MTVEISGYTCVLFTVVKLSDSVFLELYMVEIEVIVSLDRLDIACKNQTDHHPKFENPLI